MDQYPIKSVTFGGFDKQDVARYIEQAAKEKQQLEQENEELKQRVTELQREAETLREKQGDAAACLEEMLARIAELEPFRAEAESLRNEVAQLRGDAETYRQVRSHLGEIECEAQKRADQLENETVLALQRTVDLFRAQYQNLMSTFETTANHVTGELRKMEVNLSQLPRAMDQSGAELNELAAVLERRKKND